jgi:hypothetical protein
VQRSAIYVPSCDKWLAIYKGVAFDKTRWDALQASQARGRVAGYASNAFLGPPRNKKEPSMGSSLLVLLLGRSLLLRTGALATLASAGLVSLTVTFTGGTLNGSDWIHAFHAMAAAATWLINSSTSTFGLWAKDSGNVCSANICSSLLSLSLSHRTGSSPRRTGNAPMLGLDSRLLLRPPWFRRPSDTPARRTNLVHDRGARGRMPILLSI